LDQERVVGVFFYFVFGVLGVAVEGCFGVCEVVVIVVVVVV
jgi:hypothetical protein